MDVAAADPFTNRPQTIYKPFTNPFTNRLQTVHKLIQIITNHYKPTSVSEPRLPLFRAPTPGRRP